VVRALDS